MTLENHAGAAKPGQPDRFAGDAEVHSITGAGSSHSEAMRQRMRKYALAMGIRMVCLVLVFVVDGWFKIVVIAGAVFLPWVAVLIANGGDLAAKPSELLIDSAPLSELDSPEPPPAYAAGSEVFEGEILSDDVLQGEVIEDDDTPEPRTTT